MPADLHALAGLVSASSERMAPDARRRVRQHVLAAARADARDSFQRALFVRAAAVFTVGATLLGGVSFASAAALPGDALYGVKRGAESVAIAILPEGVLEREFLFKVADRRAEEIRRLIAEGADPARVQRALDDFGAAVREANQVSAESTDLSVMTRSQERLVGRIRSMAGSAREQLELEMQKALSQQPTGGGGTNDGATGTGSGTRSTPGQPSTPAPVGPGSSDGSAPTGGSGSGSGSGGSGSGSGGSTAPDANGSSDATGGPLGHRGP